MTTNNTNVQEKASQQYWSEQLKGLTHVPLLSSAYTSDPTSITVPLPAKAQDLVEAKSNGTALSQCFLLMSGLAALQWHYTRHEDSVVAMATDNDAERTAPWRFFRQQVSGDMPFRKIIGQTSGQWTKAKPYCVADPHRFASRYMDLGLGEGQALIHLGLYVGGEALLPNAREGFDLMFCLVDGAEGVRLILTSRVGYLESLLRRLAGHFFYLLCQLLESVDQSLSQLDILSQTEKAALLDRHDRVGLQYDRDATIISLFQAAAATYGSHVALHFEGTEMSYAELDARSNQLAHALQAHEAVASGAKIGVHMTRSGDLVIAILGVLKAGCAYVPLDPSLPVARLAYMVGDACPTCIIADIVDAAKEKSVSDIPVLRWDTLDYEVFPSAPMPESPQPDDLAYIIYTSGSTGQPKGVMVGHRQVARLLFCESFDFDFGPSDTWTLFHGTHFDFSVWELWGALLRGGKLVVLPHETAIDPEALLTVLMEQQVTVLNQVPTMFAQLWETLAARQNSPDLALRYVIFGGEALQPATLAGFKKAYPATRLVNMYGITETTVHVTYKEIEAKEISEGLSNIGRVLPTLRICLLASDGALTPQGAVGEIAVGGAGVALGYLDRPELTAERFIEDPHQPGSRLYLSGDLGVMNEQGDLLYVGRKDQQVKVRGYRIEPGEIAHTLMVQAEVTGAAVTVCDDTDGDKMLVAYVTGKDSLPIAQLREGLSDVLPQYMVPAHIVQVEALPYTTNGKLDMNALPAPTAASVLGGDQYVAPRDEVEQALVAAYEEVLGIKPVGIHDNFFDIGGHSLKGTRLITRIYQHFQKQLPLRKLFQNPTVAALAEALKAVQVEEVGQDEIPPAGEHPHFPLSPAQRRMWLLDKIEEDSIAYNLSGVYTLDGSLNTDAFYDAFRYLVDRHEILRTVFETVGGKPVQRVIPAKMFEFEIPVRALEEQSDAENQIAASARQEMTIPFDLEQGPLFRAALIRHSSQQYLLFFSIHHIIADGWSMQLLIKSLFEAYNAFLSDTSPQESPLSIQYKDYASWVHNQMAGKGFAQSQSYWHQQLSGALPVLALPTDHARPVVKSYKGATYHLQLGPSLSKALYNVAQQHGVSLYMALLSVSYALFHRYTTQEDIIVGSPVAGRQHTALENQLGMFVNTLVLRQHLNGALSFAELLAAVKDTVLEALDHQAYPFEQLVDEIPLPKEPSRSPFFDVMVILQNTQQGGQPIPAMDGLAVSHYPAEAVVSKFDLTWSFEEADADVQAPIHLTIEYDTALYHKSTIEGMAAHWQRMAEAMTAHPAVPIGHTEYLTGEEKDKLLSQLAGDRQSTESQTALTNLIETQAAKTPNAIALRDEEMQLSYAQANRLANQYATYLRQSHGAKPGTRLALLVRRDAMMPVYLLAILKTGAAYVPIDAAYPAERIKYMLTDAEPLLLIADQELHQANKEAVDGNVPTLMTDSLTTNTANLPPANLEATYSLGDVAYFIYTSGSTGKPKGVIITHCNLAAFMDWCANEFGNTHYDTMLAVTSYCFDLSVFEMFYPLVSGKQVRILPSALELGKVMGEEQRAFINTVPSVVESLLNVKADWQGVSALNMAGELVPNYFKTSLNYHDMEVRNLYGPSEDTTYSSCYRFTDDGHDIVPAGRPVDNTHFYLLDGAGQLVPEGMAGELCITGAGVANGYWKRETLTAERFVNHPLCPENKLYKTGDLARWLPDGNLQIIGRKDTQVKLRGYRIEMGEVESALESLEGVSRAVACLRQIKEREPELVAYLVADQEADDSGGSGTVPEVSWAATLLQTLPAYMVPTSFAWLPSLPLNANGKVDRKVLEAMTDTVPMLGEVAEYVAPRDGLETKLAGCFGQILGRDKVGINDHFFAIGGNSLKVVELVTLLGDEYGGALKVMDLFSQDTVAGLAVLLRSRIGDDQAPELVYNNDEFDEFDL